MSITKSNFIEDMRKKLNTYNIEKLQQLEEKHRRTEHYRIDNEVKTALMEADESSLWGREEETGEITGWSSNRNVRDELEGRAEEGRKSCHVRRRGRGCWVENEENRQKCEDAIGYFKGVLTRLQSPVPPRRPPAPEGIRKADQNLQTLRLHPQKSGSRSKLPSAEPQTKFRTLDLNSENSTPFSTGRASSQYKKIKRKPQHNQQYEVDIAYEKNILQRLIRGSSGRAMDQDRGGKERFSLKNLLC